MVTDYFDMADRIRLALTCKSLSYTLFSTDKFLNMTLGERIDLLLSLEKDSLQMILCAKCHRLHVFLHDTQASHLLRESQFG